MVSLTKIQARRLIHACFFLSGTAGLVYEVVWARQLGLFLGITFAAHTAVITAFMAGLAAGSFCFGRAADRSNNPLRLYAWLEVGIGLYAALTPWLFQALQSGYAAWSGVAGVSSNYAHTVRFLISLIALLIPTFLMGGTLPLLVKGVLVELPQIGRVTSRLYGINTLGAVSGVLAAGYFLMPAVGMKVTIFFGVLLNFVVAAIVILINRGQPLSAVVSEVQTRLPQEYNRGAGQPGARLIFLCGFAGSHRSTVVL